MSSSGLIGLIIWLAVVIAVVALMICLLVLVVRALKKYLNSRPVHQEAEKNVCKSLGEVIRENRIRCGMTQEFVAQSLGVSRQAVSKWENGTSDPSTSNLLSLAKLFQMDVGELLANVRNE